jgi:hypothetical protein
MPSRPLRRYANDMNARKPPKPRLIRKGSVLVVSIPGARKMSMRELNEWIRKSRERKVW